MSLLLNMLSWLVRAFLTRSKCLLISWLQAPSAVILELQKIKSVMKWWDQMPWSSFFECWVLSQLFHSPLSLSLRGSSLLSAISMVSFVYLRLLIFLPEVLIPACASSSPAFCMMYSTYKLNNQSDNMQPWHTPFPIWHQSVVLRPVLTVASGPAYRFLRRKVRWSGIPVSLRIFHSLLL